MLDEELISSSEAYMDAVFWPGAGRAHTAVLGGIAHEGLRASIHRCHLVQHDTRVLSVEDNYLIGMCVLYAIGCFSPADMFAKALLHLGTDPERLLEAAARLSMWIGPIPAARSAAHLQRAIEHYAREGRGSLAGWIPHDSEAEENRHG